MKEKLCDTCRYRNNVEQLKPCIVYRDDCEYYEKKKDDMTREEVIRIAQGLITGFKCESETMVDFCNTIIKALEEEPKWIPVSERLPIVYGWYQCTVQVFDLVRTMELYYKNGKWLDNRRVDMFNTYDIYGYGMSTEKHKLSYEELKPYFDWTINVIAWMPLSEPYKAESEDKECIGNYYQREFTIVPTNTHNF